MFSTEKYACGPLNNKI